MTDERKQKSPVVSTLDHMQGGFIQGTVKSGDVKSFRNSMSSDKNKVKVDGTLLALGGASSRSNRRFRGLEESPRTQAEPSPTAEARGPTSTLTPPSLTLAEKVPDAPVSTAAATQTKTVPSKTKVGPDSAESDRQDVKPEGSASGGNAAKAPASGCCVIS